MFIRIIIRCLLTPIFLICSIFMFIGYYIFLLPILCLFNLARKNPESYVEIFTDGWDFGSHMIRELWQ